MSTELWHIKEGPDLGWNGTWTKLGEENGYEVFSVVQKLGGITLTAKVHLIRTAEGKFGARKFDVSDGNPCTYWGDIDDKQVSALYHCKNNPGEHRFEGTISLGS